MEETGETLVDNARLKARALATATGRAAVADDTGLEVDALGGAPGVYSARYAGPGATYADNVASCWTSWRRCPTGEGTVAPGSRRWPWWPSPTGGEIWSEGVVEGSIAAAARGDGGFGYDPVFVPDEGAGRTFSEMTADEKHALSHRGRAFRALAALLAQRSSD